MDNWEKGAVIIGFFGLVGFLGFLAYLAYSQSRPAAQVAAPAYVAMPTWEEVDRVKDELARRRADARGK